MPEEMTPERYARVKAIFMDALDLTAREQRALLDERCAGDTALRAAVEALLGAGDAPLIDDAPPADDPLRVRGAVLEGGFTVGDCVAEGGFSHVYRGADANGRPVALKVLKPGPAGADARALRQAFEQEARLLDQLKGADAAVVETYGLVELTTPRGDMRPVLLMEWLDGQVLAAMLSANRRRWPLAEVREVLDPVARTVGRAHAAGIAHRDIKPDNIFITTPDAAAGQAGRPSSRLFDFGVAKVAALHTLGFEGTGRSLSAFTVSYAAPEQVSTRFGTTGPWTDVYALALVVAEMLGGARPLQGAAPAMMAATLDADHRPVPDGLDAPVATALRRALSVEPRQRPPDANAFWDSLAEPAPRPRRWWRFGR